MAWSSILPKMGIEGTSSSLAYESQILKFPKDTRIPFHSPFDKGSGGEVVMDEVSLQQFYFSWDDLFNVFLIVCAKGSGRLQMG